MDLRVLGPLEVAFDGRPVPIRPGLPRKLLVTLILRLGERVSRDTLVDVLWADEPPGNALNALQILISYLRKALAVSCGTARIETVDGGYRLVAARDSVDAFRLERVVSRPDGVDPARRLEQLDAALSQWRGPPVPEVANDEFAQPDVHRFTELRLAALEQRADALLGLGRNVDAAVDLQGLVLQHPLRERFYALLMTALYRSGRQAEALAVYDRARTILREELGLDPGPELQATEQAVLEHAPQLGLAADATGSAASTSPVAMEPTEVAPPPPTYPRPLEGLIGREGEVARLTELMRARRVITLTGPGGAGKTRLAAELAAMAAEPVWWVDLSAAVDREGVLAAVAGVTGIASSAVVDEPTLAAQLTGYEGLLVLDTCERVRPQSRRLVESLLRAGSGLSVVATSRQPLGAPTELAWPVPPLSLPHPDSATVNEVADSAAVQLFVERAANRRPGFELTEHNCVDVAGVCLLLDGLPLAIELAAAHAAALDPATMLTVLDDRLRLLVDDAREDRQQTLRSTIAWSYDLLPDDEATFFERLSVFAGPFSLEGAVAVGGEGLRRDGLELLLALTRQSLVAVEAEGRYRLLDTIRAFASERLEVDFAERAAARRRHARWYAQLLTEAAPEGRARVVQGWRGELRGVMPDLLRALEWCFSAGEDDLGSQLLASLWWLWPREGVFEPVSAWFEHARTVVPAGTVMQADLLASAGTYAVSRGDLVTAADDCARAAQLFDQHGNERGLARCLIPWGIALWGRGDHVGAADTHERAAALFERLGDDWGRALALVLRARTAFDAQEPDASARLKAAETAARGCGDRHVLAAALVQRARAEVGLGHYDEAAALAEESLRLNDLHGHREGAIGSLHALGLAWVGQGLLDRAHGAFVRALATATAIHHGGATAESLDGLAIVACRQRRWFDAARVLAAADTLRANTGIRRSVLVSHLVAEVETVVSTRMDAAELHRARLEGSAADLLHLAAEERSRASH